MGSDQSSMEILFHLVHAVKRRLQQQAEQLNLGIAPMHIRVIKIIDRKAPCTAVDIASFLGRDKAQVTRLLNTLIEKGLITREPNPEDKRSHFLHTTKAGDTIVEEIRKIDEETLEIMTRNLNTEELEEFRRIARLMTENLRSLPE